MLSKSKKIISTILMIVFILSTLSLGMTALGATTPSNIDTNTAYQKIYKLHSALGGDGSFFTTTQKAACGTKPPSHQKCDNCELANIIQQSWFKNKFGTTTISQYPYTYYPGGKQCGINGWSCFSFATFAEWYIYSTKSTDKVTTKYIGTYNYDYNNVSKNLRIGDLIRLSRGHSAIAISWNSTGVTVLDSNWSGNYGCQVYIHRIDYSYSDTFAISRATNSTTGPVILKAPTINLTKPTQNPTNIPAGSSLGIWGTVSANGAATTVKGEIKISNMSATVSIGANDTLNLQSSPINEDLKFDTLKQGSYTLVITATNSMGTVKKEITVNVGNVNTGNLKVQIDDLSISYLSKLKDNYPGSTKIAPKVSGGSGNYSYTWTSSNPKVATVDANGNIKAIKRGAAEIKCTVKDNATGGTTSDTCEVNVTLKWYEWILWIFLFGWAWY